MTECSKRNGRWVLAGLVGSVVAWTVAHVRSPVVRRWSPSAVGSELMGPLVGRCSGSGDEVLLLLHGLGATSEYWPASYDALAARGLLVVPDLLGFGRSLDEARSSFTLHDHADALDSAIDTLAPDATGFVVVAHSMGAGVALEFARRHIDRVVRVVCIGAPVYPDERSASGAFDEAGAMGRVFLLDTAWAQRLCALSCRHRRLSGWLTVLLEPRLPVAIARRATLHTWPAYRDSVRHLILHYDWATAFATLAGAGIEIELLHGSDDTIGDQQYIELLVRDLATVSTHAVDGADHHLAITHAAEVIDRIG